MCNVFRLIPGLPVKQGESHPDDGIHQMLQIGRGDHLAFNELWRKYKSIVKDFLASRRCPESLLDDLAQEVFTRVWEHRQPFRGESTVKTYLCGIAKNVLREQQDRDRLAKYSGMNQDLFSDPSSASISSLFESKEDRQELIKALNEALVELPAKTREVVELIYISDIPAAEAAKLTNCSIETFRRRFRRGMKRLSELLEHRCDG